MNPIIRIAGSAFTATALLSACRSAPMQTEQPALASLPPPEQICSVQLSKPAPELKLPKTDAPNTAAGDDKNIDIAQIHTVNRPLQEIGVWSDQDNGWSVLELSVGSQRARSLAIRLRDVTLPKQSALWLCAIDGKHHQGPYTEAPNGELWSASVTASQARIEVWVPSAERAEFSALLTDVYGGYQP